MTKSPARKSKTDGQQPAADANRSVFARRHILFGWWSLLVFLSLGIVLESLHGLKVAWYLNVGNETRRLMWTLAHAHGTLLSLVNLAFGLSVNLPRDQSTQWCRIASSCLVGATVLLPSGFFLGGCVVYGGDPGMGVLLVPVGAALLLVGVLLIAWKTTFAGTHPS